MPVRDDQPRSSPVVRRFLLPPSISDSCHRDSRRPRVAGRPARAFRTGRVRRRRRHGPGVPRHSIPAWGGPSPRRSLPPEQAADRDTLPRRFQNEAQSAARLDHDNIARVYYVGEDRGLHYIVFEFIEGVNVRDLVEQKGPLPLAEAISYTLQVADALAHAAGRDVVHRDIKPSNVLITPEGQVKLIDMGLARLRQADRPRPT